MCFDIDYDGSAVLPVRTVEMSQEGLSDLAVRKDGRLWVAACWDGRLRVFASKTGKPLAILKVSGLLLSAIHFMHCRGARKPAWSLIDRQLLLPTFCKTVPG